MSELPDENPAVGILLGYSDEEPGILGHQGVVSGNRLTGPQDAIRLLGVTGGTVADNLIEEGEEPLRNGIQLETCTGCQVTGNRLTDFVNGILVSTGEKNRVHDNHLQTGGTGLSVYNEAAFMASRNRLDDVEQWGFLGVTLTGKVSLHGNRIRNCGHIPLPTIGPVGIGVLNQNGELQIESCEVVDTGVSVDGETIVQPARGIAALLVLECRIQGNLVSYSNVGVRDLTAEDRALLLQGYLDFEVNDNLVFGFCAQVLDNKFVGTGATALVEFLSTQLNDRAFLRFERVTFNNNYCFQFAQSERKDNATVYLRGRSGIVIGNHIKSTAAVRSVIFDGMRGIFMGNDTRAGSNLDFPSPESAFNH